SGGAGAAIASGGPAYVAGEILVQFSPGADAAARSAALSAIGGGVAEVLRGGPSAAEGMLTRVSFAPGLSVEQAAEILSRLPGVRFAEPNYIQTVQATSNDPAYTSGQLWGMYGDGTSPANQFGSQSGEAWAAGHIGSTKVAIGVIDSGVDYTHADLYLNIWLNQGEIPVELRGLLTDTDGDNLISFRDLNHSANSAYVSDINGNGRIDAGDLLNDLRWENGINEDGNIDANGRAYVDDLIGWDFVNGDNDPYDDNNHGTHVSGTIAGMGGNGAGVAGVAWTTQIVGLKFLSDTGSGSTSGAILAVDYFTNMSKVAGGVDFAATNNSWGGGGFSQALLDSIGRGALSEILFVAAAGNGGRDGVGDDNDSTANYPSNYDTTAIAGYDAVIAVASITSSGSLSSFSNYGATTVDLGAPGSSIYSTLPGGTYGTFSGTSMATPHVAGALALFSAMAGAGASAAAIKAELLGSAAATASLTGKTVTNGRLDVGNLMDLSAPPPPPPGPNLIYGTTGNDVVTGTTAADKIWGIPADGTHLGRGTVDRLGGNGGADVFVFGDSRGRFYDDGSGKSAGTSDYAVITDWGSDDKIQLFGTASAYFQKTVTIGSDSGMGIYHDSNGNGRLDTRDELIGIVKDVTTPLGSSAFEFVT
ncbi:MAG: S8 family serine peptidase, partial [Proteobacteria bacterium]|nr:S8 family serine peptidase [Pseudomonadota bacterium]